MKTSRRTFIKLSLISGGSLFVGYSCAPIKRSLPAFTRLSPFIEIGSDGTVSIMSKNPEIGQGVSTSLPMIIAEELCVEWSKVQIKQADYNEALYGGQWAGGSLAVRLNWDQLRMAGAIVRDVLLAAGANLMKVDKAECIAVAGRIRHEASGNSMAYEELLQEAVKIAVPEEAPLKEPDDFTIIGTARPNDHGQAIVTGRPLFGIDQNIDGMVYASILKCPYYKGKLKSFDDSAARKVSGVIDIFPMENAEFGGYIVEGNNPNFVNGIAVVGTNTWSCFKAKSLITAEWEKASEEDSDGISNSYHEALQTDGELMRNDGNADSAIKNARKSVEATYQVPFLAHVTMEPMNCLANYTADSCEVWAPTQNPKSLVNALVKIFNFEPAKVKVHLIRSGGGFGRRYYVDYGIEAAILSRKVGKPVKVTWTREDDIRHDLYRPAAVHQISAALEDDQITGLKYRKANASRKGYLKRDGSLAGTELDEYEFPAGFAANLAYRYHPVTNNVPLGQWRAVSHSSNVFAMGSFLDEVAHSLEKDPIEFYLNLLGDKDEVPVAGRFKLNVARLKKVIDLVAERSGWYDEYPGNVGKGFSASYNQGAFVAHVAEVTLSGQSLNINRITAAIDCGIVVNPSGADQQVRGAILEGLCAALYGEINIAGGRTLESNFHDYPWLRIQQTPKINVHFIESSDKPRGLGEPPLPPVAPAICNAIFAANGKRIRQLPILKYGNLRMT